MLVFLENYTLLEEIYEKFHEKFKTVNQNSLLDEFKYVDMRQEVTRDKLEKIYIGGWIKICEILNEFY